MFWRPFLGLLLLCVISNDVRANPSDCEGHLSSREQQIGRIRSELEHRRKEAGLLFGLILKTSGSSLERRALEECARKGNCTEGDIARAVRANVEIFAGNLRQARGYGIILGAWVAGLGAVTYLNTIESAQSYAPVTAMITGAGLTWIGAPIMSRLGSRVGRKLHSLLGLETSIEGVRHSDDNEMEKFYLRTQATIGSLAQIGGQRLNQFLDSLDKKMTDARIAVRGGDRRLAVDQIAEIAVRMRELFPDVMPAHKAVARVVQTTFLSHIDDADGLLAGAVRERIKELDPAAQSGVGGTYYNSLIKAWFGGYDPSKL